MTCETGGDMIVAIEAVVIKVRKAMSWKVSRYRGLTVLVNIKALEWLTAKQCILEK